MVSRREFLTIGTGGLAAASLTARAWAQAPAQTPKRGGTLSLRTWDPPHFDHILAHAYKTHVVISFTHSRLLKHKAGPGVRPGAFPIEGDLAESWQQVERHDLRVQAQEGRALSRQAAGQRPRADGGGRPLHVRAHPDRQGQRQRVDVPLHREGRGGRQVHRAVHAEGALRLVPRHDRQPDGGRHHRQGVRREVRRPEEAGGGDRHRPVDARRLQAERLDHPGAQSDLLRRRPAVYRPGGDVRRRGQCLPHRGVPRRQVRPRLGVPGHDPPDGLGADRRGSQEAPPQSEDRWSTPPTS